MLTDRPDLVAIILLAVVFVSLGFIQVVFQQDIQQAIQNSDLNSDQSRRNFEAIVKSEQDIHATLVSINSSLTHLIGNATEDRQRDANLTKEETEGLVADIRAIPGKLELVVNQTAKQQSNFTAQETATKRILNMTKDLAQIKQALNITEKEIVNITTATN